MNDGTDLPLAARPTTAEEGREYIVRLVKQAAIDGCEPEASDITRRAREAWAYENLSVNNADLDLAREGHEDADAQARLAAAVPSLSFRDLGAKLALFTQAFLEDEVSNNDCLPKLRILASVLADCLVLQGGEIALPEMARFGIRNHDSATAGGWSQRWRAAEIKSVA